MSPGLYLAGVIVAGSRTNEIFIENGRFHGRQIAADIAAKLEEAVTPGNAGGMRLLDRRRLCSLRAAPA